jgi:outer membrane protein, heavy metal efflux system
MPVTVSSAVHLALEMIGRAMPRPLVALGPTVLSLVVACGCASGGQIDPQDSARRIAARTGAEPRVTGSLSPEVPPGIRLDDGLTPDEAVALALWNNTAFQVSVAELGFARADLLDAGLLANPVLSLLFPLGPKQLEAALRWPVELLWQRPRRVAAAQLAGDAAAARLVQTGLDLVLSVRVAYADLGLAVDRERIAGETAGILTRIDALTQSRLRAGDIGALDARAAQVDAARARQESERAVHDITIARERLRLLLGLTPEVEPLALAASPAPPPACGALVDLLREARVARPDVRVAELAVEAAGARLGWERSRILTLTAVLDANGEGTEGFEHGPGIDVGLPIVNRNQGGRVRAQAELQRASAAYAAIQQQVALELREASVQFEQARQSIAAWRNGIVSPLQANLTDAERSFAQGESSYLFVLENSRRLSEAKVRERELGAEHERARARIERAVGRSCGAPSQEATR